MPSEFGLSGQRAEVVIGTVLGTELGAAYGTEEAIYADFLGVGLTLLQLPDTTLEKAFIHGIQYFIAGDDNVSVTLFVFEGIGEDELVDGAGLRPRQVLKISGMDKGDGVQYLSLDEPEPIELISAGKLYIAHMESGGSLVPASTFFRLRMVKGG